MLRDSRLIRLAKVLVRYSVGVKKGDLVSISGSTISEPLALEVYREVLDAGGHPWLRLAPDAAREIFFEHCQPHHLTYVSPIERAAANKIDVSIGIWADANTKAMSNVDPKLQATASKARQPLMKTFMRRSSLPRTDPKRLRWTGTMYPNNASAQDAQMSLSDYADFVFRAGKLDKRDPVKEWKKLGEAQQRLADRLEKGKEMHITAPNGTDIRFGIKGRNWINCDGHENFPDGEVFTGPLEDATEGVVHYSFPAVHGGREVNDIRFVFKGGKVVEASASSNEEFLFAMLDQDKGGRILGELALGTNYSIKNYSKNTLFDEKIGGTFHAAVGAAYPESGGKNQSGLHWDMVCALRKGGVVKVDGEVISRNGRFQNAKWPR
jgi:aminopeptidase